MTGFGEHDKEEPAPWRFELFGASIRELGWDSARQEMRYEVTGEPVSGESPFLGPDRECPPHPDYPLAIEEGGRS